MSERAEAVAAGTGPMNKDRFVKIIDTVTDLDQTLVERARDLAGLKRLPHHDPRQHGRRRRRHRPPRALPDRPVVSGGPRPTVRPGRSATADTVRICLDGQQARLPVWFTMASVPAATVQLDRINPPRPTACPGRPGVRSVVEVDKTAAVLVLREPG